MLFYLNQVLTMFKLMLDIILKLWEWVVFHQILKFKLLDAKMEISILPLEL
jgi:hypothetical protein